VLPAARIRKCGRRSPRVAFGLHAVRAPLEIAVGGAALKLNVRCVHVGCAGSVRVNGSMRTSSPRNPTNAAVSNDGAQDELQTGRVGGYILLLLSELFVWTVNNLLITSIKNRDGPRQPGPVGGYMGWSLRPLGHVKSGTQRGVSLGREQELNDSWEAPGG
jgi:hypothetical protein